MPADVKQILADPEFQGMAAEERRKVLATVDESFAALRNTEQDKVLGITSPGWKQTVSNVARPTLEFGMMAAGGLAGAPMGPFGAALGGTLGYGAGGQVADLLDEALGLREPPTIPGGLKRGAQKLAEGEQYEMLYGPLAGAAIKGSVGAAKQGWKAVKVGTRWVFQSTVEQGGLGKEGVRKAAGAFLEAHTSRGPIYAKNEAEAMALEKEIPGLKFTRGQKTFDPEAIAMERAQLRTGTSKVVYQETKSGNDEALRKYMLKNFPDNPGVQKYLDAAAQKRLAAAEAEGVAIGKAEEELGVLATKEAEVAGTDLVAALRTQKGAAKNAAKKLYDEIPDTEVNIKGLVEAGKSASKPYGLRGDYVPPEITNFLAKHGGETAPTRISFSKLREYRTSILEAIREETGSAKPNLQRLRKLEEFKESLEATIGQLGDEAAYGDDIVKAYREASTGWAQYKNTYEKGTIGDVLRRGARGEETRLPAAQIAEMFWRKPGNVDPLVAALGSKEAAQAAVRDYANYDLVRNVLNPVTGKMETARLSKWIHKNRPMLNKLGIAGEYSSLKNVMGKMDEAMQFKADFEASAAARMLDADPLHAIAAIFKGRGSKSMGTVAQELLTTVKGNQPAIEGLRSGMAKHIMQTAEVSAELMSGAFKVSPSKLKNVMATYDPALRVLYKDAPGKYKAIKDVQKAYLTMERTERQILAGDSSTAENISAMVTRLGAPWVVSKFRTFQAIMSGVKLFSDYRNAEIDKYLTRAMFDSEYAETLIALSRGEESAYIMSRIGAQMSKLNQVTAVGSAIVGEQAQ